MEGLTVSTFLLLTHFSSCNFIIISQISLFLSMVQDAAFLAGTLTAHALFMLPGRRHNLHRHHHIEGLSRLQQYSQGKSASGVLSWKMYHWHKLADAYTGWGQHYPGFLLMRWQKRSKKRVAHKQLDLGRTIGC